MANECTDKGWAIASMGGTFLLEYTFARTRTESIKKWMDLWDPKRCSWRKFKRQGYKCVKAQRTIKIL